MVRVLRPVSKTLRTAWSCRFRLAVALTAGLAGSLCVALDQSGPRVPNIDQPPVMGPDTPRKPVALPVESLQAVHDLDLKQPAKTKLPKFRIAWRASAKAASDRAVSMPALVAPTNDAPPPAEPTTPPSDDQPPVVPKEFAPEWRSSGKGKQVVEAFTLPKDENQATDDQPPSADHVTKADPPEGDAEPSADELATTDEPADQEPLETVEPLKPLTRNQIYLRNKLRKVLSHYYRRPLNSRQHDAWEAMHGMLAYGLHSRIRAGGPRGESMTAIGWLCYNNPCKRKQIMRLNSEGEIRAQYGVGLQGHMGQFLAMLAQCDVDRTYPIRVADREFTIEDLIESEKDTCYPNTELTFKLIGLMHYIPSDAQWVNDRGESWSIERLIEEELKQPIRGAACGGTHRLGGLSLAVKKREARGESVDGAFQKAAQFTHRYEQYAFRLQNSDGSFSTEWFRGPGRERDINRRCRTSGHLLEWILYQVDDDQLTNFRVVKGVNYLTNLLYSNSTNEWEIGPLCHALHALSLYDQRVFQPHDEPTQTAQDKPAEGDPRTQRPSASSARRSTSIYRRR